MVTSTDIVLKARRLTLDLRSKKPLLDRLVHVVEHFAPKFRYHVVQQLSQTNLCDPLNSRRETSSKQAETKHARLLCLV